MPRQPRLDAPNVLHHVMVRGWERRRIFRDDRDRTDFVARVARLAESGAWTVFAWALLPNHAHLLVRTGTRPLPRTMRSLLTGYAGAFNRRHQRVGHLFQNRYKSIVVEEEPYLLELVRYLHLNPLRAKVLATLQALDPFPWTGHSALLGTVPRPWQDTQTILRQFGPSPTRAMRAYRAFVAAGLPQGRRPELQGGGLLRSQGDGRPSAPSGAAGRPTSATSACSGARHLSRKLQRELAGDPPARTPRLSLEALIARVCRQVGLTPSGLHAGGRHRAVARARAGIAYLGVEGGGHPARPLAALLGVSPQAVYQVAARGQADRAVWEPLLPAGV